MVTIRDIAKAVGVSVATISYVFNGKGNVGDETKPRGFDKLTKDRYEKKNALYSY